MSRSTTGFLKSRNAVTSVSPANTPRVLTVKHTYSKVAGWLGVVFSIYACAITWRAGDRGSSLVILGFAALGIYLILTTGSMQVDSDSITYHLPLRSYQIKWNEVRYIEIDRQGHSLIFVGDDKTLATQGHKLWTGKDKMDMPDLIATQVGKYGIEIRLTEKAAFRFSRNTKVGA